MKIDYTNDLHDRSSACTSRSAQAIAPLVCECLKPGSVVDVGCGHGHWLKEYLSLGVQEVLGIDGDYIAPGNLVIPPENFMSMDLTRPVPVGRHFDLAICVEVAEHLPTTTSRPFVEYLCSMSDHVLFSAAIPGQPGHGHINAQWPDYWLAMFRDCGYVGLDFIRPRIWHMEDVLLCHRQNVVFYVREQVAQTAPWNRLPRMNCLTLIDTDTLGHLLGAKESLKRVMGKLIR